MQQVELSIPGRLRNTIIHCRTFVSMGGRGPADHTRLLKRNGKGIRRFGMILRAREASCEAGMIPDDDKYLAAASGGDWKIVVSGDKRLLDVNGHEGIEVPGPSEFTEKYLSERSNAAEQPGS
jgi:hypothetical protein